MPFLVGQRVREIGTDSPFYMLIRYDNVLRVWTARKQYWLKPTELMLEETTYTVSQIVLA